MPRYASNSYKSLFYYLCLEVGLSSWMLCILTSFWCCLHPKAGQKHFLLILNLFQWFHKWKQETFFLDFRPKSLKNVLNEEKRLKTAQKKYSKQLLGARSTWKPIEIHNSWYVLSLNKSKKLNKSKTVHKKNYKNIYKYLCGEKAISRIWILRKKLFNFILLLDFVSFFHFPTI